MNEDITHWPVTGSDGFGGFIFGTPVLLKGRWEEKAELYRDNENEEHVSQSVVYTSDEVDVGDYLALGDHATVPVASPTSLTTAFRILQRFRSTNLRAVCSIRKAYL